MGLSAIAFALLLYHLPAAFADDPASGADPGSDTGVDTGDTDTGTETGEDSGAGTDIGTETGTDTGTDTGEDSVGTPADTDAAPPPDLINGIDLSKAREAPALTEAQHDFLKPKRSRLPQNPYAQTDFTAYTLEWGEFKIGLAGVSAGVLPRTQLATVPVLWALGIPNGNIKVNAVRFGPVDLAVTGDLSNLGLPGFFARKADGGLLASAIIVDPWSVHVGVSYGVFQLHGEPDLSRLSPLVAVLGSTSNSALDAYYQTLLTDLNANTVELGLYARTFTGRVATDIRFNRRDSLILQGTAVLSRNVDAGAIVNGVSENFDPERLPDVLGVRQYFSPGARPLTATGDVTASWQFAWKHFDLRLGLGYSAVPFAWLLQSLELDYRFGGATRAEERRIRKGWRKDKKHIDEPDPASPPD